jgi:uncharacterized protein YndB with AHSA1/START domain
LLRRVAAMAQANEDGRSEKPAALTGKEEPVALIVSDVEIARPPGEVFAYVTDPSRFGEWQSSVVGGHIEGDGPPKAGSRCITTRRIGGSEQASISEITQVSPPAAWAIRGINGPIRADVNVTVDPVNDGQGSHVSIRLDFHGHGIRKLLLPIVVRQARKEAPQSCQALKKRLETGDTR